MIESVWLLPVLLMLRAGLVVLAGVSDFQASANIRADQVVIRNVAHISSCRVTLPTNPLLGE